MKNVLVIESSPRLNESFSRKLTVALLAKIKQKNPAVVIKTRDLTSHPFPHLEESILTAFFTPPEKHTDEHKKAIENSNVAIAELKAANTIVIGVPMYNFGIPSVLKAWIDHICRAGLTFRYTANGPEGLLVGKKVYLAIASGGIYSEGPMKAFDFAESYLKAVFGFLGITDVQTFRVEGISIPGVQETALEKAIHSIQI